MEVKPHPPSNLWRESEREVGVVRGGGGGGGRQLCWCG